MSWFKSILLLSVLGMTWVECGRRPAAESRAWPEAAAFEAVSTNAVLHPAPRAEPSSGLKSLRLALSPRRQP